MKDYQSPLNSNTINDIPETQRKRSPVERRVMLPTALTAENGAKGLLSHEFFEHIEVENPDYCGCGTCDFCLDFTDVPETIIQHVPIKWTTIKDIYAEIVKHYTT